ncbi:MAG: molybdenum cofactor biosynthesis protein [Coriobacteriia bacterium]|nr:molybdenum cofactor biosynthesis protein [Coriobacteriia bacterium]
MGQVVSVNLSEKKTVRKKCYTSGELIFDRGFEGDAHAGDWHRQVSLLATESIKKMQDKGLDVGAGDFAENITTEGVDLLEWPVGTLFSVGESILELSQIGKICHNKCAIYYQAGDCVMPREGIFAVVRKAAKISVGDEIKLIKLGDGTCDRTPRILLFSLITVSDTRTLEDDTAGAALEKLVREKGHNIGPRVIVKDDQAAIEEALVEAVDNLKADIVITCGGTGVSLRDVTPEATANVCNKMAPGISEVIRAKSYEVTHHAILSRAVSGLRGTSLIINFPGSKKAAIESFGFIQDQFEHAIEMVHGSGH